MNHSRQEFVTINNPCPQAMPQALVVYKFLSTVVYLAINISITHNRSGIPDRAGWTSLALGTLKEEQVKVQ